LFSKFRAWIHDVGKNGYSKTEKHFKSELFYSTGAAAPLFGPADHHAENSERAGRDEVHLCSSFFPEMCREREREEFKF